MDEEDKAITECDPVPHNSKARVEFHWGPMSVDITDLSPNDAQVILNAVVLLNHCVGDQP